jgi:hypothetical protein
MDRMPDCYPSSADANAMIARTAPAILERLGARSASRAERVHYCRLHNHKASGHIMWYIPLGHG